MRKKDNLNETTFYQTRVVLLGSPKNTTDVNLYSSDPDRTQLEETLPRISAICSGTVITRTPTNPPDTIPNQVH